MKKELQFYKNSSKELKRKEFFSTHFEVSITLIQKPEKDIKEMTVHITILHRYRCKNSLQYFSSLSDNIKSKRHHDQVGLSQGCKVGLTFRN